MNQNVRSQSSIAGHVLNDKKAPVEFANVLLLKSKDSSLVKGVVSDKKGAYQFLNIPPGNYLVSLSFTGFQPVLTGVFLLSKDEHKLIDNIALGKSLQNLEAVKITARKPFFEQKIDRLIVNVASSVTFAGGTALEVLERSPGVTIDRQNGVISLNGKEGVIVMINGKISRMPANAVIELLTGMSANNIERIELVNTPPSNFDAEGNAGYINIVMKENMDLGTNGSYNFTTGYSRGGILQAGININHRKGKFNLYGDLSFSTGRGLETWDTYKKVIYQNAITETVTQVDRHPVLKLFNGRFGADYTLSSKTIIGVLLSGFSNHPIRTWDNTTNVFINQKLDTSILIAIRELNKTDNLSGNFNVQHNFSKNDKLTVNLNYDYYLADNPVEYGNEYFDATMNFLKHQYVESFRKTPLKIWIAAGDYSKTFSKKLTMEAGVKATASSFTNTTLLNNLLQDTWQRDDRFSSEYHLRENIMAAYLSLSLTAGSNTVFKSGLRYEHTTSVLDSAKGKNIVDRRYGNIFPTFFFSRTIDKNSSINFTYSKRITRPTFKSLAPTTLFVDPYTYFYGNPALQASASHALSAAYVYKRKILSVSYTYEDKPITDYLPQTQAATNMQSLAADNQKNRTIFFVNAAAPFEVNKWWTGQISVGGYVQKLNIYLEGTVSELKRQSVAVNFSQNFLLPKDMNVEVSGTYNSGGFFTVFYRKPYGTLNAGIQKKFARSRSSLRLNGVNILNTNVTNVSVELPEKNLISHYKMYFAIPAYRITYTRNFGNAKLKQARDRVTGAEDAKQRAQ